MANRSIKLTRESDLLLDNWKQKVKIDLHKIIPKKDINDFLLGQVSGVERVQKNFWKWAKDYAPKERDKD